MSKDAANSITATINMNTTIFSFVFKVSSSDTRAARVASDQVLCMAVNPLCCISTPFDTEEDSADSSLPQQNLSICMAVTLSIQCGNHLNILIG